MLRAFGRNSRRNFRTDAAWTGSTLMNAVQWLSALMMLVLAALLARLQPVEGIAPFALALLAAGTAQLMEALRPGKGISAESPSDAGAPQSDASAPGRAFSPATVDEHAFVGAVGAAETLSEPFVPRNSSHTRRSACPRNGNDPIPFTPRPFQRDSEAGPTPSVPGQQPRTAPEDRPSFSRFCPEGVIPAAPKARRSLAPAWTGFAALLTGTLSGTVGGASFGAVALGAGTALAGVGGSCLVGDWLRHRRGRASPTGRTEDCGVGRGLSAGRLSDAALSVAAGVGALAPGLLMAGDGWMLLKLAGSAGVAAAAAPFFRSALEIVPRRRHLMPEERVGGLILTLAALAGLAGIWLPGALALGYGMILMVAPMGAGASAGMGLGAGAALMLFGGGAERIAALGLGGLAAGAASGRNRWTSLAALSAASLLSALILPLPLTDPLCALAGCAASLAVPEGWRIRLSGWLSGEERGACDPDRLARRLRAETGRKLRAMSAAFGELAEGYREPIDMPDEQALICQMRTRLCEGCSRYPVCWAGDDNRAVRFLCQLISQAIDWSAGERAEPLFGDEVPPDVLRQCARGRSIPSRLGLLLEEFSEKRRSELKRGAVSQLISAQFTQAQLLLQGLADVQARPVRLRGRQAARARAALDRAGLEVADVMALRGARRMELVAALKDDVWTPDQAAQASFQLSRVFGRPYAPEGEPGSQELKFVRLPRLRATAASASHPRMAGAPCGDSCEIRTLEGDRLLLMLSDGMGSGEAAAQESAQTLRLLGRFLAADVARPLALETVNELMLARSDADMFATVDLCVVDLLNGTAEFSKLAAGRSMILRNGEVTVIEGGRLPLGILERVQPSVTRIRLEPGDVIVMASDGVTDVLDEETLSDALIRHGHQPPDRLAELLTDLAERTASLLQRDDMTVLSMKIASSGNCCRA